MLLTNSDYMCDKSLNSLAIILLLLGCAGSSRYIIRFPEPEKYFAEDRYYVSAFKSHSNFYYGEELYFRNGTVFMTSNDYKDITRMPIGIMAAKETDEFLKEEENPHVVFTYGKSYYSSWGRYTIVRDTIYITELVNNEITAYRLLGWKKRNRILSIQGDTLLHHHYKTGELVPDSVGYSVYKPNVKLDFMDSRKAWIYKYNEYPKME